MACLLLIGYGVCQSKSPWKTESWRMFTGSGNESTGIMINDFFF